MRNRIPSRFFAGSCLALTLLGLSGFCADEKEPAEEGRAGNVLAGIEKRMSAAGADAAQLRRELLTLRIKYPGTRAAMKAAALMGKLPSALDRMSPDTIPTIEKFDWQPKDLVAVLGEHLGRHGAAVSSVAFSADSKLIASGGGGLVRLWNADTMRLQAVVGTSYGCTSVAISKDRNFLAAGTAHGHVYVWALSSDKPPVLRFTIAAATSPVYGVAFHPDSKRIACACFDNVVRVYDVSEKELKDLGQVTGHKRAVLCVAYSPDGKTMATGSEDLSACIWDSNGPNYKERSRMEGHSAAVQAVAFTPSGGTLATGCGDGTIRLWTLPGTTRPKAPRLAHQGPKGAVTSLSFSSSGQTLAANCGDNTVRLWNVSQGFRERPRLDGHAGLVRGVAYSPNMKLLVSGGDDWVVRTWDLNAPKGPTERFVPWSHLSHVYSVAFAPDDRTMASGSYDTVVRFWELDRPQPRSPRSGGYLKGDGVYVYGVAYSPDGKLIAAAGHSAKIRQWETGKRDTRPSLVGHPTVIYQLAYSPDGKRLLSASGKEAFLFDPVKGATLHQLSGHETPVTCMAFSPDGKRVLTGSGLYLYDKMGKIVIEDGKYVYTDCVLKLWDVESGKELAVMKDAKVPFACCAFTPDGRTILASHGHTYTGTDIRRWALDGDKLMEKPPLKGSTGYVSAILASADGTRMITRGSGGQLTIWDVVNGKPLRDIVLPESIGGFALTTDGRHLAIGLATGVIYIVRLEGGPGKSK